MSGFRGKAVEKCSLGDFLILTHSCHSAIYFAVMHNAVLPVRLWWGSTAQP